MARGDSLARQLQLFLLLDAERELSVDAAASRLGCTRRTVYRDLDVLQRVGMPLYQEPQGRRARWRLADGFRRRLAVTLGLDEIVALVAGARALDSLEGTVFRTSAARALDKLSAALSPQVRLRAEAVAARLSARAGPGHDYTERREALHALMAAVEAQQTVELVYRKLQARRDARYTVDPYHLHLQGGAVYVIGWAQERRDVRVFLLDRVRAVRPTGQPFTRRREVDALKVVHGAFGVWSKPATRVRLRFRGRAALLVAELSVHQSQVSQWRNDRELDVTLQVPVSPALVSWVRGFGKDVAVLEPKALTQQL